MQLMSTNANKIPEVPKKPWKK